ncbi:hypothetical protein [Streptomyces sp. NBC_00470]|uniref:hypothetical protein n=1 Tax=Streptomyces sp. NBC_00470 TaxID=2975753 RepID=UPI003251C47D
MAETFDLPEIIAARRAELEQLTEKLKGELDAIQTELAELTVADEVARRLIARASATPPPSGTIRVKVSSETAEALHEATAPAKAAEPEPAKTDLPFAKAQVPQRTPALDYADLPESYRPIVFAVREAGMPMRAVDVSEELNLGVEKSVVETVRPKLVRLAKRGWLAKLPNGKFEALD